jgi:hypothetical protein
LCSSRSFSPNRLLRSPRLTIASILGTTKSPRHVIALGVGILLVLTATIIVSVAVTSPSCSFRQRYLCTDVFKPAPRKLLSLGEIEFHRLGDGNLALVRISPTKAREIADHLYGRGQSNVVFESLGGYIDKNQIIPDWVGTRSYIPKVVPSYIVRIHENYVVTVDPSHNHYWNVIVNAVSGKIEASISYD